MGRNRLSMQWLYKCRLIIPVLKLGHGCVMLSHISSKYVYISTHNLNIVVIKGTPAVMVVTLGHNRSWMCIHFHLTPSTICTDWFIEEEMHITIISYIHTSRLVLLISCKICVPALQQLPEYHGDASATQKSWHAKLHHRRFCSSDNIKYIHVD